MSENSVRNCFLARKFENARDGGAISFDAKGQNNNIGSATVQNIKKTPTVVLPKEAATAKPVFPMPGWRGRQA